MQTYLTLPKKASPVGTMHQPLWQRIILLTVLAYEAAGALMGGIMLITAPDGRFMNMPVQIMHGVFPDFRIPGFVLFGLGMLNAFACIAVLRRYTADWWMAALGLGGFIIWFVVEIIILQQLHWLHLMWGLPVLIGWFVLIPLIVLRRPVPATQKNLLLCGIFSSAWYVIINIYVPLKYEGYDLASWTVSELSAIGAPTRQLWVLLALLYPLLFAAFGWGVWYAAGQNRPLRVAAVLLLAYSVFNLYWPPMHMRGVVPSLTDTLHLVWASVTVLLMIALMAFGAVASGARFRTYTIASIALNILFGVLTFLEAPNITTGGATPTIGIFERINIGVFMLWIAVFAMAILKKEHVHQAGSKA